MYPIVSAILNDEFFWDICKHIDDPGKLGLRLKLEFYLQIVPVLKEHPENRSLAAHNILHVGPSLLYNY